MIVASDIEKEIKYLTQLKNERFNDAQLCDLANAQKYGKSAKANKEALRKRNNSAGDPTLKLTGRFLADFPGVKDNYIEKYNANKWHGYIICEGPDPSSEKRATSIQSFIENVLDNPNHYAIDISTLLVVGSATDKLPEYGNVEAYADYFTHECNYGSYTLKPMKFEHDKSTPGIKHIRLNIKQRGREIKELDIYQVMKRPTTIDDLHPKDIVLLHEIALSDSTKIAAHDATGLDYAAAFILAFYFYQHFDTFVDEDRKISEKFLKDLKKLNVARPGAIQNSVQFIFAIKLSFELYQVKLNQAKAKFLKTNFDTDPKISHPTIFMTPPQPHSTYSSKEIFTGKRTLSNPNIRHNIRSVSWSQTYIDTSLQMEQSKKLFPTVPTDNREHIVSNSDIDPATNVSKKSPSISIPIMESSSPKDSIDSSPEGLDGRSDDLASSPESINETPLSDRTFHLSSSSSTSSFSSTASASNSPRIIKQNGKVRLVCIIGCLDTKPAENEMLRKLLIKKGFATFVIDVGTFGPDKISYPIDIEVGELVKAAGYDIKQLRIEKQRPKAVVAVKAGLAQKIIELNNSYDFDAVIGMGGTNGTDIITSAMQQLPDSIPKVCISTVAGHHTWEYTKGSGIILFDPITDIGGGVNSIVEQVIVRAVGALAGMIESPKIHPNQKEAPKKPTIVTSKFGVTTPAVDAAAEALQKQGYDVLQYHMVGTGGKNMEALIRNGAVKGCLDITLAEITSLLDHGVWSAGDDRLSAAVDKGIPQVISLGAMDMTMLDKAALNNPLYKDRTIYKCNPDVYAMKTGIPQYDLFARFIIDKLQYAKAPVIILIPTKGLSKFDDTYYDEKLKINVPIKLIHPDAASDRCKDISWHDSYANQFFFSLITKLAIVQAPHVPVIELDCHINDPLFAKLATKLILLAIAIHDRYQNGYELILTQTCEFIKDAIKHRKIDTVVNMDIQLILREAYYFKLPVHVMLGLTIHDRFKQNYKPILVKARELIKKYENDARKIHSKPFDFNFLNIDEIISEVVKQDSATSTPKEVDIHANSRKTGSEIKNKVMPQVGTLYKSHGLLANSSDDDEMKLRRNSAPSAINLERDQDKKKIHTAISAETESSIIVNKRL